MATRIRYVTFDATGTLLRPRARIGTTYVAHCLRFAAESSSPSPLASSSLSPTRREALERAVDASFPLAFRAHTLQFPNFGRDALSHTSAIPWWSRVILASLPDELVVPLSASAQQQLTAELYAFYASGDAWTVFDDVAPTLETLKARGVRMAVISDFDERLPRLLSELKLASYFSEVTTSWALGATKPSPRVFQRTFQALAGAKADPTAFLHVGDHVARDYDGATAVGAHARLLNRRGVDRTTAVPPTNVLSSLQEIVEFVPLL